MKESLTNTALKLIDFCGGLLVGKFIDQYFKIHAPNLSQNERNNIIVEALTLIQ